MLRNIFDQMLTNQIQQHKIFRSKVGLVSGMSNLITCRIVVRGGQKYQKKVEKLLHADDLKFFMNKDATTADFLVDLAPGQN